MKLTIGSDHAGFRLKGPVVEALRSWGYEVEDLGTHSGEPIDFPVITKAVCAEITAGRAERAILVCGSGIGACMAANKIAGIRAALCHDVYSAHQSVEHDDATGMAAFAVTDCGPGVPESDWPDSGRRFARSAGSLPDSAGLGLAIVNAVAEAHRGKLVFSRTAEGRFRVALTLPAERGEQP